MTAPTPPLNLSADATNSTTADLVWSPPSSDGGKPITQYTVQRKLPQVVFSYTVDVNGSGYSSVSPPTLTISGGDGTGATAVLVLSSGTVSAINVVSGGIGFTTAPTVSISAPVGLQATATATLDGTVVGTIAVDVKGLGYNAAPNVLISGGGGMNATAEAFVSGGEVTSISVINQGMNFTSVPTVTIAPPPTGTPAEATANLSGANFATIGTAFLGTEKFTDSTLFPRNNPIYQIIAINIDGPSDASDSASTTTATSEAQIIAELLFNNWSLTGELDKVASSTMTEAVHFFDRGQVPGNKFAKSITVQKINALGNENIVEHARFFEESNTFEVTCFLQVIDSADDQFSVWVDLMQQMTGEVTKILRTKFAPSAKTGEFFRTNTNWTRDDTFFPDDPELVRTLRFVLTRIVSNDPEVFVGYPGVLGSTGVLVLSILSSSADNLPTTNHTYTQTERIQVVYGWRNIPYLTTINPSTTDGVPIYFRGQFSGQFSCDMYLDKDDITPVTFDSLAQLVFPQPKGELGTAAFLVNSGNTESPVAVLTQLVPVNITSFERISENEELIKISIRGNLVNAGSFTLETALVKMVYEDGTKLATNATLENDTAMEYEIPENEIMAFEPESVSPP